MNKVLSKDEFITRFLYDQRRRKRKRKHFSKKCVFTSSQKNSIIEKYKKGYTFTAIAKDFDCSRTTISRRLRTWGVINDGADGDDNS